MQLGIHTNVAELQKTREYIYTPDGYEYGLDEPKVIFHLRPWTRTTQAQVEKRAKAKNINIGMDEALRKIGTGDRKAEAYTRELADFLITGWENVVYAEDVLELGAKKGDEIPCTTENKIFLFEDVAVAVKIIDAARSFATVQMEDEAKNSERSSDGADVPQN